MASEWVSPKYAEMIGGYMSQGGSFFPAHTASSGDGSNCSNCSGVGRIIYVDPDGSMRDIPCGACAGSGQSSL